MQTASNDPLLVAAKAITIFLIGVLSIVGIIIALGVIAFPLIAIFSPETLATDAGVMMSTGDIVSASIGLVSMAVLIGALLYFFRGLLRLIRSVGEGDPFTFENARRLAAMGWSLVVGYISAIVVAVAFMFVDEGWAEEEKLEVSIDAIDLGGLLTILLLFILARVFRHGAAMREDLEGTV